MADLATLPVSALLELHADLLVELRSRAVVRSLNNPAGDYGELLFSKAFGWTLSNNATADADATDAKGLRYQIKCRRLAPLTGSRQLGHIRRLPKHPFDYLAAVLLDHHFRVLRAAIIPFEVVEARATFVSSVRAWRFILRDTVWSIPGVVDVTAELKATELLI